MTRAQKNKKKNGKCITPFCRTNRYRNGSKCCKCRQRRFRANCPITSAYHNLKSHAKARGIEFDLTFEQFNVFCIQTGYDKLKGGTKECLTVDRKHNDVGYTFNNIRAITMQENSFKGTKPYRPEGVPF